MPRFPLALLVLSIAVADTATGQTRVGLIVGGVSSTAAIKPGTALPNQSSRLGYAVGASVSMPLGGAISFAPEIMYITKGLKASFADVGTSATADVKLTAIEIPVLFRWSPAGSGRVRPTITAGPSISLAQKCTITLDVTIGSATSSEKEKCGDGASNGVTSTDFGAMFGVGLSSGMFSVSARYDLGLKNVSNDPATVEDVKNRAILVVFGISR